MLNTKLSLFLKRRLLIFLVGLLGLMACNSSDASVESQIRKYLYDHQPTSGEQFVVWANRNLSDYSPQQIMAGLYAVGQSQAKDGHPSAVGVLSHMAQAWARQYKLDYDAARWHTFQQTALTNMPPDRGEVQFWPDD